MPAFLRGQVFRKSSTWSSWPSLVNRPLPRVHGLRRPRLPMLIKGGFPAFLLGDDLQAIPVVVYSRAAPSTCLLVPLTIIPLSRQGCPRSCSIKPFPVVVSRRDVQRVLSRTFLPPLISIVIPDLFNGRAHQSRLCTHDLSRFIPGISSGRDVQQVLSRTFLPPLTSTMLINPFLVSMASTMSSRHFPWALPVTDEHDD